MYNKYNKAKPNDGEHIKEILTRTTCEKHDVPKGEPCFYIKFDSKNESGPGICNDRVLKAGYNGTITSSSSVPKPLRHRPSSRPARRTS